MSLLQSKNKEDVIKGAYLAGESGSKEFVPILLENAYDFRTSTTLNFKGFSVYQAKMIALKKIYKEAPPGKITSLPDSAILLFFNNIYKQDKERK
jgi:hypothetical protein